MNHKTTASVSNLPKGLAHTVDMFGLERAINVAQASVTDAQLELADLHDHYSDLMEAAERGEHVPEGRFVMAERNVAASERRRLAVESNLQALTRERDARVASERLDEVNAELLEVIADVTDAAPVETTEQLARVMVRKLTSRVRRMERVLAIERAHGMKTDSLADAVTIARAALYVAMERTDLVARLAVGVYVPVAEPEGWSRQSAPAVVAAPEGVEVADGVEAARLELSEAIIAEVVSVEEWEADAAWNTPMREERKKWANEFRRDGGGVRLGLRSLADRSEVA